MSERGAPPDRVDGPTLYEIRIEGYLDDRWAEWFEGMSFTHDGDGTTVLRGPVVDQAALYGLLRNVRNLALPLVSVLRVDRDQSEVPRADADAGSNPLRKEKDA